VLLLATRHLTTGRAAGVDLWRRPQSGNGSEITQRNAAAEGVFDRVKLFTADMVALPFEQECFDVVSNVAIHNVRGRPRRDKVIDEALRVLRPGDRRLLGDAPISRIFGGARLRPCHAPQFGMADVAERPVAADLPCDG